MIPTGPSRHPDRSSDAGWQSDPAVDAGFAAAYREDPWQDEVAPGPVQVGPARADPGAGTGFAASTGVGVAPLVRPALRPSGPSQLTGPEHRTPGRAVTGAAVAVGGVLLGIGSLLWVTDEPTRSDDAGSRAPVTVTSAPTAQAAPVEVETAPPDSPVQSAPPPPGTGPAAPVPAPAPPAPEPPAPEPAAVEPAAVEPAAPSSPVVPVTVLNNSDRDGLADRAAARFERGGWPVQATGNFRGRIPVTTVYYDRGLEASARAFADTFPGMVRVRPRFETLPARGVVVVLTREYSS